MFVHISKPVISVKKAVELIQFLAEECATKSSQLTFFLVNWCSFWEVLFASQSFRIPFTNVVSQSCFLNIKMLILMAVWDLVMQRLNIWIVELGVTLLVFKVVFTFSYTVTKYSHINYYWLQGYLVMAAAEATPGFGPKILSYLLYVNNI